MLALGTSKSCSNTSVIRPQRDGPEQRFHIQNMSGDRMKAIRTQVHKQTGAKGSVNANSLMISEMYPGLPFH